MHIPPIPGVIIVILSLLSFAGCQDEADTGIVFGEGVISVGGRTINVDLALTAPQMEQGLKYRRSLDEDRGMIFIYSHPVTSSFWMKDTHIPLSIAFINSDGIIISIQKMEPDNDQRTYHPPRPFLYALEMNQGWFERNNIRIGDKVVLD
jgi:uncharacterized protein